MQERFSMKVRVDCYLGEDNRIDLSFLEQRKAWLPGTGIYLEFILKGIYNKSINFKVEGGRDEVLVSRYSWNRFFLNLKKSGDVSFTVLMDGEEVVEKTMHFNVVNIEVPLVLSVPNLLIHPVADVRYFANRLSENLINTTRFVLFTPGLLEKHGGSPSKEFFKFYEMLFSILTERGITLIVSPYGDMVYALDFVKEAGKDILWEFVELGKKYKVIWDFTSGLRKKELAGLLDSVWNRFKEDVSYAVFPDLVDKVGGEGFSYIIEEYKQKGTPPVNDKGIKIAKMAHPAMNFYTVRSFTRRAVESNWGVELSIPVPFKQLRNFKYSLGRAIIRGYADAKDLKDVGS